MCEGCLGCPFSVQLALPKNGYRAISVARHGDPSFFFFRLVITSRFCNVGLCADSHRKCSGGCSVSDAVKFSELILLLWCLSHDCTMYMGYQEKITSTAMSSKFNGILVFVALCRCTIMTEQRQMKMYL